MGRGSTGIRLDDDRFKPDLLKTYCSRNAVSVLDVTWMDVCTAGEGGPQRN